MSVYPQPIQNAIDNPKEFRFGDYIQQGLNIAKQNFGGYIGYFFVLGIIMIAMCVTIIGILPAMLLSTAFTIGCHIVAHKIHTNQQYEFKDFFGGMAFWQQLIILAIVIAILNSIAALPYYYYSFSGLDIEGIIKAITSDDNDPNAAIRIFAEQQASKSKLVAYLYQMPMLIVRVLGLFSAFLVVFFNMTALDALAASFKIGMKYFGWLILFNIVMTIITLVGVFGCFIGVFFTAPIAICAQYAMMADLTGLNDNPEDDTIRHFVTE